MNVSIAEELFVKAPTRVGLLAEVTNELAAASVDLRAIGAYDKEGNGEFYLLTSDNDLAAKALGNLGVTIVRNDVVVVGMPNRPGALAETAAKLADAGINVDWVYATTSGPAETEVVFRTADPARTAEVLGG